MTRTTDEVVKPLPGQMAFRFMHAESGPAERLEPEQEAGRRTNRSRRARLAGAGA